MTNIFKQKSKNNKKALDAFEFLCYITKSQHYVFIQANTVNFQSLTDATDLRSVEREARRSLVKLVKPNIQLRAAELAAKAPRAVSKSPEVIRLKALSNREKFSQQSETEAGDHRLKAHQALANEAAELLEDSQLNVLAMLVATGCSLDIVAEKIGFEHDTIALIAQSDRFLAVFKRLEADLGIDASARLLCATKLDNVRTLLLVRDAENLSAKDRMSAALALNKLAEESNGDFLSGESTLEAALKDEAEIAQLLSDPTLKNLLPR